MNTVELLNWGEFKRGLQQHAGSHLQFQYLENKKVDASYHITEIKQAPITSVDCGGVKNSWTEIILQLLEPNGNSTGKPMRVDKALAIIERVEKVLPLNPMGIVKIEFGNSDFQTRQMYPADLTIEGEDLVVNLQPDFTQCKAIGRGGSCGTENSAEECCAPEIAVRQKTEIKNIPANACCGVSSGCC